MLKKIGLGLAAVVAIFVVVVALQPADFRIERSTHVNAPAPVVFGMIQDFHAWNDWSPWAKLDPQMKQTWTGAAAGKGAIYDWKGNDKVGQGRMEILSVRENESVDVDLHFMAPFEAKNRALFTVAPDGNGVKVTWAMTGKNNFISKAFGLFFDMDKMVGKDFEKGLAQLKSLAEDKVAGH